MRIAILPHDKLNMQDLVTQFFTQKKASGFAMPAALFLTFLCTTVIVGLLNRSSTADLEKYLRLNKLEASNLSRQGLESVITQIRRFPSNPAQFPANTWNTTPTPNDATYDTKVCGVASQFSSNAVVRISLNRYLYKNYALRYFAVNEVDGADGNVAFPTEWRIVSCVISTSKPYFAKSRSALLRFAIQDNGASISDGTVIDIRDY